jgi:cell division protein FtsA
VAKTILAIDIGSMKVSAIIAEIDDLNQITIIGHGITKSQGVKKGIITNIELASRSIKKAVTDARRMAGNNISVATISISNAYAKSINATGIVNIPHKDISIKEIRRAMDTALYNARIPKDYEIIHVLPYNFKVDDQIAIEDPYGMNASRLEVEVNIVIAPKTALINLQKTVRSAGVEVEGIVLNSYASAIATMSEDERSLGVCVIDMGGQTSNMIIHAGNSIRYTDFLPVGSNHITNDLSVALHTPLSIAEMLKIKYGNLIEPSNATIDVPIMGDNDSKKEVSLEIVHSIIIARVEETLMLLAKSLNNSGFKDNIGTSVVLTGGMTQLKGIRELAQTIFQDVSVRIGYPRELNGVYREMKNPSYSTVIGLLLYQAREHTQYEINYNKELLHHKEIISDMGLRNIDLGRDKSVTNPQKRAEQSHKGGAKKQMNIDNDEGFNDDPFDFDRLPDERKKEQKTVKKLLNWAKQLF